MSKNNFSIRLLSVAEEDFTEIISFIAADNTKAALNLANKIEKNLELLADNPLLGKLPSDSDQCTLNLARKNIKATVANDLNFTLQELDEFITFLVQDAELIKVIGHLYYTENVRDDYQKVLKEREAARARKIKSSSELLKNSSKLFSISPERNNRDRYRDR